MKFLLVVLVLCLTASGAFAEIYTWKDGKGTRFYTNSIHEIPARYLKRARVLDVATGKVGGLATAQPPAPTATAAAPLAPQPPPQGIPSLAQPVQPQAAPPTATAATPPPAAVAAPVAERRSSDRAHRREAARAARHRSPIIEE